MSQLRELVAEYCPNGVPTKTLGEIGTIFGGLTGKSKVDFSGGNQRYVSYVNVFKNIAVDLTCDDFVRIGPGERQRSLQKGDILFTASSETRSDVAMSSVITGDPGPSLFLNSFCIGYRFADTAVFDPDFAKHLFRSADLRKQLVQTANGVTRFNVSKGRLAEVRIPVPPVVVQQEIARLLDLFMGSEAELEAELEAETEARRAQFAGYRDSILSFVGESATTHWRSMGEVGTFTRGRRFTKADVVPDGIPSIHYGEIYTHYGVSARAAASGVRSDIAGRLRFAKTGDVVIAGVGETVGDVGKAVAWLGKEDVAIHDDCFAFSSDLDPTYVVYAMQTAAFQAQKNKHVARAKVKRLARLGLSQCLIPVPALGEQRRMVNLLDRLHALTNGLCVEIHEEIRVRRQQYAHYRDRWCRFEEESK